VVIFSNEALNVVRSKLFR